MHPESSRDAKSAVGLKPDEVAQMKSVKKVAQYVRNTIDRLSEPQYNTPVKRGKGKKKNRGKKVEISSK